MGFQINRRDWINFTAEGVDIRAMIKRPTGLDRIKFESEYSRIRKAVDSESGNIAALTYELFLDFAVVVLDRVEGVDDSELPDDQKERRRWLDTAGWEFVTGLVWAVLESGNVQKNTEKKS